MSLLSSGRFQLLKLHPVDVGLTTLLVIGAVTAILGPSTAEVHHIRTIQIALLIGYVAFAALATINSRRPWVAVARPLAAMTVIFTLYCTLSRLGILAMPYRSDPILSRVDTWIFGGLNPTFRIQKWQTPRVVEFFSIFYALFIPYVNVSLVLGAWGRPPLERDRFLIGWVIVYCISLPGCLFAAGIGPGGYFADQYTVALSGGVFYHIVLAGIASSGGLMGIFPSLHVGSSVFLCLFDLQTNRLRGLTYLPIVLMIYGATICLRYHYVIDTLAGTLVAVVGVFLGNRICLVWARSRRDARLPALPGGEVDVLPVLPAAGDDRFAPVLPTH